jgi:hypothetical protein
MTGQDDISSVLRSPMTVTHHYFKLPGMVG